jgi:Putative Ig domain
LTVLNPPPPVITSATTASGTVGVAFSYQITATNNPTSFNATALPTGLTVNTTTGVISGTPTTAGTYSVTISATNAGGTGSATLTLTINNPVPTTTSISPASTTAGSAQFTLTVNGANFVSTSAVYWNGSPLITTFVSSTKLTAIVPAANVAAVGTASVTVVNPAPGGGTSNAQTFTINPPPPVITSPTTATGQVGVAFSYTITATNSPTSYNATGLPAGLTVNTSTGLISGTPTTAGTYSVTISATNAGGTGSATLTLTINPPAPVITSALTATGQVGAAFSYTITATNSPTSYNATVLPAGVLPAGLSVNTSTGVISGTPTTAGTYSVTISATNAGGTGSATLTLTINNQVPTTTSISPTCTAAGSADFTLTVNGTKFGSTSTVNWNGMALATTFVSSTQLTATVPTSLVATAGTASITVVNPSPGGGRSNVQTFTISATPAITSALTATGAVGAAFSYTITATNNPTSYTATGLPPGLKLETPPPSSDLGLIDGTPTTEGTYNVTITATNGAGLCSTGSATLVLTIISTPVITSTLTATGTAGSPFSYQITATSSPASYDADGLPGGLSVDPTTGLISGTPTGVGTFSVTISATNVIGTGSAALTLTITLPSGVLVPPFAGQVNVFDTGLVSDPSTNPGFTITFPNATTDNYFQLYWNLPAPKKQNDRIADLANGGLQRNQNLSPGMRYNPYDPTNPNSKPDPTKNVWRGNPTPPNDNSSGQFGDPRASWYITDPWPAADYVTSSYWGGPTPQIVPLNWPDSGHRFRQSGVQPSDAGKYPDALAKTAPTPDPTQYISSLSTSNSGSLASITELGNVWDPAQLSYSVTNPGDALPDIPSSATLTSKGGGGHTLAVGRPEFSKFDTNGMRAWQLLDVFSGGSTSTTNTAGLVNLNTASRDVLRALAAGILENRDPAMVTNPGGQPLYPPTVSAAADQFADAVINSRPLLSTAALSAIRVTPPGGSQPEPFFGNSHQYSSTQTQPTEWNDAGREELFAKIYNLATTRSRNFRVFVTGQSLDKNGNVLSTVTKVYQVFVKPTRDPTTGAIQKDANGTPIQQVQIKYEGSM